jgi:hypothetical protein
VSVDRAVRRVLLRNLLVMLGAYSLYRMTAAAIAALAGAWWAGASFSGLPGGLLLALIQGLPELVVVATASLAMCLVLESGRRLAWALALGTLVVAERLFWTQWAGNAWPEIDAWFFAGFGVLLVAPVLGAGLGYLLAQRLDGTTR